MGDPRDPSALEAGLNAMGGSAPRRWLGATLERVRKALGFLAAR